MAQLSAYLSEHQWLTPFIHAAFTVFIILIINLIIRFLFWLFESKLNQQSIYLKMFYHAINKPVRIITWIIGLWALITQVISWQETKLSTVMTISYMALKVLLILSISWALLRFAKLIRQYFIEKHTRTDGGYNDFSTIEVSYKISQIAILIITGFSILSALNIPLIALAGFSSIVMAALAISQQELIKNLFGGFVIYLDRAFSVGDWIYTTGGAIEGTVEKISFRVTLIRGFDKRPIYVPNSTFLTASIVNASRMSHRRILQYIGVRYQDFESLPGILSDIRKMLKEHTAIDQKSTTLVCIVNGSTNMGSSVEGVFGSYSINFMIYTFTKTTNWARFQAIQDEVMFKIGRIIREHGAQIAFPTTTLDLPNEALAAYRHSHHKTEQKD
ncbi:MAG: mechanosensitive ion channel family protein [Francisellaceae bacterium]